MSNLLKRSKLKFWAAFIVAVSIINLTVFAYGAEIKEPRTSVEDAINKTSEFLVKNLKDPGSGTYNGEWSVIGLARYDLTSNEKIFDKYYENMKKHLKETAGVLHERKYTEYSRAVVALSAIGADARNVGGYNMIEKLADYDNLVWQGINGAIWGLIALDTSSYQIPDVAKIANITTRQKLIDDILDKEIDGGGWSMGEDAPDPDVTAMVLQALAKYKDQPEVKEAVDRALNVLSNIQNADGGYSSWDVPNLESAAQVLTALCALGIDCKTDERFIKNKNWIVSNMIDNYYLTKTGGFKHMKDLTLDGMATDQGMYALVAYDRLIKGKTFLYDMSDVKSNPVYLEEQTNDEKVQDEPKEEYVNKFTDIDDSPEKEAIVYLSSKGIISGYSDNSTEFKPNENISRAQFAAIITKSLLLDEMQTDAFPDVKKSDWFSGYVGAVKSMNLINGYKDGTFGPDKNITREEAAVIIKKAAKILGVDVDITNAETINYLCQFTDYVDSSDWSMDALAVCVKYGYIPDDDMEIFPLRDATREEIAGMIYRMIKTK